jgi:hypothetical protein
MVPRANLVFPFFFGELFVPAHATHEFVIGVRFLGTGHLCIVVLSIFWGSRGGLMVLEGGVLLDFPWWLANSRGR